MILWFKLIFVLGFISRYGFVLSRWRIDVFLNKRFDDLSIARKLTFGFGAILFLMILNVSVNFYGGERVLAIEHEIVDILVPVIDAELELKSSIYDSLAALRGFMILGENSFKEQRENAWKTILKQREIVLSKNYILSDDIKRKLTTLDAYLNEFEEAERKVEAVAHTKEERPATEILLTEAAPRASKIIELITQIIDIEKTLPATEERKALLALLADSRGSFAVGLASIRAYLLSGDTAWRDDFRKNWAINESRLKSIQLTSNLFSKEQKPIFDEYSKIRAEFSLFPEKMFSIRGSDKWNKANYLLASEVVPRANKSLDLLKEISDDVAELISKDQKTLDELQVFVEILTVSLVIVALFLGVFIAYFTTKRLTLGINTVTSTANKIANGELDATLESTSKDEVGMLLRTIDNMRATLENIINDDIQLIIDNARKGDLSKRIECDGKIGCYRDLSEGINQLMSINQGVISETVSVFSALSNGDLNVRIDSNWKGDFAEIKNDANATIEKLNQTIQTDVQSVINMAAAGDFSKRVCLDNKQGFFLNLGESINQLIDANQRIIQDTSRVLGAMSTGHLSQTITGDYQGAFAVLKKDANDTITKLKDVIEVEIQGVVRKALEGDLHERIDLAGKQGFFKELSESINQLSNVSSQVIFDVSEVTEAIAKGDLTKKIDADYKGDFNRLKVNVNTTVYRLQDIISEMRQASELVNSGSSEIFVGITDLSARTEQQASSLEETAASMEEMTSSVEQSASSAKDANEMTIIAEKCAIAGGETVDHAISAMQSINDASNKIADIIGVIDEIAFQTNLLALNAAVEAARAGEQGRGFAVVAGEVRILAQRSADAAKEIKDLISRSVDRVNVGSQLVNGSGDTLKEIIESVKKVSKEISGLSIATQQQHIGISQVNSAVLNMDQMTQQNATLVEESSAACQSLSEQAQKLNEQVAYFHVSEIKAGGSMYEGPNHKGAGIGVAKKVVGMQEANKLPASGHSVSAKPNPSLSNSIELDDDWNEF